MINVYLDDRKLREKLAELTGPKLRRVGRRVIARYTKPVLDKAKALVPVESGRIRASLGRLQESNRSLTTFTGRIGTRRDFTFTSRTTKQKLVSGRGASRDKMIASGTHELDKGSPNLYAGGIEFGTTKDGRIARRAGGAHYLNESLDSQSRTIISGIAAQFRAEINRV